MIEEHPLNNRRQLVVLGILSVLLLWFVASYSGRISPLLLPTPTQVLDECISLFRRGILLRYTMESITRVAVGWTCAVAVALPIGVLIGASRRAAALFQPALIFARYLPVVALLPLTILYFGIGNFQKCSIVFLGSFFHLTLMIGQDVRNVPKDMVRAALSLGISRYKAFTAVLLPASLPAVLNSLRVSIGWAWAYLVIAELVAANDGLGYMILSAQRYVATDRVFGGLIIIGLIGVLTDFLFGMFIDLMLPWRENES